MGFLYSFCKGSATAKCKQESKAKHDFVLVDKKVLLTVFRIGAMV